MKVVIDIERDLYDALTQGTFIYVSRSNGKTLLQKLAYAIFKGKVLPEGHEDLIERDKVRDKVPTEEARKVIDNAPAIIEKDRG